MDISGNESDDHVLRELNGDEAFASQYIYERMVQKKEEERILIQKHQASFKSHIDIMARVRTSIFFKHLIRIIKLIIT